MTCVDDINQETLRLYQHIYVVPADDPDSSFLVWDSHRMPPFVGADTPGPLIEDAMIRVDSMAESALESVYARIAAAGGAHGIVP